jgi:hypothetical protein
MSDFYKKFLLEDVRKLGTSSARQIFLGAFGKHPGWDDHVEDLGLETESLIYAKTLLYVQGIGGQIDAGAWEKLDAGQQIPAFAHLFLWQRAGQFLIGRMWSSSDGKGRTRYPMVVCAHGAGVPLPWALNLVLPRLQEIEQACLLTKSAADVRAILDRFRNELRSMVAKAGTSTADASVGAEALSQFVSSADLGPQQEGWFRILYQMQSQMSAFAPGRFSGKGDVSAIRPQQVRVPKCARAAAQSILLWTEFFVSQIDPAAPILLTVPLEEPWVDVTIGEPTPHEFFCLRANPKALPLVNEVPYNLEQGFREQARQFLATFQSGRNPRGPVTAPAPTRPATSTGSNRPRFLKWFVAGGVLLLLAAAAAMFISPTKSRVSSGSTPVQPVPGGQPRAGDSTKISSSEQATAEAAAPQVKRLVAEAKSIPEATRVGQGQAKADPLPQPPPPTEPDAPAIRPAQETPKATATVAPARRETSTGKEEKASLVVAKATPPATAAKGVQDAAIEPVAGRKPFTNGLGMILLPGPGDYWVGKYEVTQAEYEKVMGTNPSHYRNPRQPVESVNWIEAMDFCRKLTELERQAGTTPAGAVYTLPTQKQWDDFLADARFDDAVTSRSVFLSSTAEVGSTHLPNKYGLFDVLGNVWEWCQDGAAPQVKVLKGGAYSSRKTENFKPLQETTPRNCPPETRTSDAGFRCVVAAQ